MNFTIVSLNHGGTERRIVHVKQMFCLMFLQFKIMHGTQPTRDYFIIYIIQVQIQCITLYGAIRQRTVIIRHIEVSTATYSITSQIVGLMCNCALVDARRFQNAQSHWELKNKSWIRKFRKHLHEGPKNTRQNENLKF